MYRCFNAVAVAFSGFRAQPRFVCTPRTDTLTACSPRCVFELVDRAGRRVYVGTAASMEAAIAPKAVQKFAGGGCEVRKVREVEGGRDALLAAKTAVVAESVASGCSLFNRGVACAPCLYEVVDEAERRVYVGVSRGMYNTNHDLRRRGVLCDGRVVRKVRDVPVGMSDAEAKSDLIAESVASGCRLLNTRRQRKEEVQSGCVFELVDRAGRRVYVGTAASMEAAIAPKAVQKFAGGGCEVRKVREVEGGRDALLAAKTAVVAESVASGCSLFNWRVACAPFLYEVVDEAERRVYVGVSRGMYNTNDKLRRRGVLCDGRVVRKVRDVPVGMSDAEAKSDLIAESVASGCRLLNTRRQRKEVQSGCVFELVDRAGRRVYVGTAASMEAAIAPKAVQKFAGGGCEVRKVREVEGGRDALLAAKTAVVAESVASGCSLFNRGVACAPCLYEVVDEAERRVYVGVSRGMYNTNHDLRRRGVLCDGRVVRKVRDVPVGMSDAEAKSDLIAESVASGCRLLNTRRQRKEEVQSGCVFELVDRAGRRVYVGTAASMEAAIAPKAVQKFAGGGCEVRKVREVEGGRDALLAAKTAVVAESVASGCPLFNRRVACAPFLYEVVDEAERRVYVGVSRGMYNTNHDLRLRGVLCDGRVVRKVRDVPVGMSDAEAKSDLIAESVASGCRLLNTRRQRKEVQSGCVFELVDRAGRRVYVGTAASMEAAIAPKAVQKFAGGGCEVRKVREVEGGRDALLAAKTAVVAESVASGCSLFNWRVACAPFLYEVVDEAERRVYVGVSRGMYNTNHDLRRRGVLCDGRVVRKVRDVPVGMSDAEAKSDLIAESVASGCRLLNTRRQRKEVQSGCVFELVDRAGRRVYVGTAASMEAAIAPKAVQKFAGGGCEVRKVREVEGGRDALLAAKTAVVAESVASGCSLFNRGVACAPCLYEVVDEAERRVYVGVSRGMYNTNHDLRRRGVLCDGRVVRKVRDVPVGMSDAEAKSDLIAESVASGCRLLNTRRQRKEEVQSGCVFELVDRAGRRVYVGTAASMEAAIAPKAVQKFAGGGCEVRKVREVEGGRDALLAAKTAVVAESVASGCPLFNRRVACAPFLYEVVDEAERRVYVGVSRGMYNTNHDLRLRGVLCDGRVVRKVRDVPVGMSDAEAKSDLIAESVASGCRLLNTRRQRKEVQSGCVFELVDRAGRRVYVGTAASMEAAIAPKAVQKFAGGGCEVRKVREVEGGRDALLAAKTAVVAESVASGCSLFNQRVACAPFLYEVVDEAERRVYVGVSRSLYQTNANLRRSGVLCDGRAVRKVRDVPVGMSDAEAKSDLIAESVASGCLLENALAVPRRADGESDVYLSSSFVSPTDEVQQSTDAFHSKHAATLELHRVGPCPTSRDEGVVYALFDDSLSVVYVGQTQYSAVHRAKEHVSNAVRRHPKRKTRLHAAMLRNGKPFSVVALEKIDVGLSGRRTFRETAVERERHFIRVLKPTLNTVFRRLACTRRPTE